jgi:hypothetical protein
MLTNTENDSTLTIRLPAELKEVFLRYARERRLMSASDLLRSWMQSAIEEEIRRVEQDLMTDEDFMRESALEMIIDEKAQRKALARKIVMEGMPKARKKK